MRLHPFVTALLLALPACTDQPNPPELVVVARAGQLELDNRSGRRIYYKVFEKELASRTRFAPCVTGPDCDSFSANGTLRIRYTELPGYSAEAREVVVFWWFNGNSADGTFTPDTMRSVVVPL